MNPGDELEEYVKSTYSFLLNMRDEGVSVRRNVPLRGKSGMEHRIDVYYEFKHGDLIHKVAIECKDHTRPVGNERVASFSKKLDDIGGISGIMISQAGYQSGAKLMAIQYNILLKTTKELPPTPYLMAERLTTVALPDETYYGEPFWSIMEQENGLVTGTYYGIIEGERKFIPLYFSKYHADMSFKENSLSQTQWCVRGLPRYAFRGFLAVLELFERQGVEPIIMFRPPGDRSGAITGGFVTTRDLLVQEYYFEDLPRALPT